MMIEGSSRSSGGRCQEMALINCRGRNDDGFVTLVDATLCGVVAFKAAMI